MTGCPLCRGRRFEPVVQRAIVPILQNAPAATIEIARSRPTGRLEVVACTECGFVFNQAFDPSLIEYGDSYDNTQCHSPQFDDYMHTLAMKLIERHQLRGKRIVEVGCGKGHFLRLLCRLGGNRGYGFDPTYVGPDTVDDGSVQFVRELYSERHASVRADFVCCRHVLEHVPQPRALLESVRLATGCDPAVPVFFEVPTLDWILEHTCFWDVFYEHCSYFTDQTLSFAFRESGFDVTATSHAFGGQYLWLEARAHSRAVSSTMEAVSLAKIALFRARVNASVTMWSERFRAAAAEGGLAIWGAGAKGVTLVNLLDPTATLVRYVVDINPNKQGTFLPGTGHPILAAEALRDDPVRHLVIMNPNYLDEISAQVALLRGDDIAITCL